MFVKKYFLSFFCLLILSSSPFAQKQDVLNQNFPESTEAKALHAVRFDISMPLRLIKPKAIVAQDKRGGLMQDLGKTQSNNSNNTDSTESVVQTVKGSQKIPAPSTSILALTNISGVNPPDANGDVGLDNIVVMTNLSFHVLSKSGTSVYGPAANNTLWSGFGGACETENAGDPVVLYDQIANRWMLSQFTSAGPEYFNCIAVSVTGDPTGSYYRWAVSNGSSFSDYPKYGIWSDAYYLSTRDFNNNIYIGVGVYALKRADMIAGNPNPAIVYKFESRSSGSWRVGDGLLPADLDGTTLPPANTPELFLGTMDDGWSYGAAQDALLIWEFAVDFDTPANSTFTLSNTIPIAAFDTNFPCGGARDCIAQSGTTQKIDVQSYRQRALHRLAYRNFGTHEVLIANQSVEATTGVAGVRWWEIRDPSGTATLYQEGTYAPADGVSRWMGSTAMDAEGNMAIAYSASSSSMFPSIRYTGRLNGDALGTMTLSEGSIIEGAGAQTGSSRWGDYTSLTVDPIDDCTFWHINEYYETSSASDWVIRAASFKFDECGAPGFYLRTDNASQSICVASDASYPIVVGSIDSFSAPVTLNLTGLPAPANFTFSSNPVPIQPSTTNLTISNTATLTSGTYNLQIQGTAAGADNKSLDLEFNVYASIPTIPVLTTPDNNADNVDLMPSLNWTGSLSVTYTIEVATDSNFTNILYTGTTTGNTIVPSLELNTSTIYYWRVKSTNSCGDSNYSQIFSFRTQAGPGDCNIGNTTIDVYNYDFESGLNGWSTSALTASNIWAESSVSSHSGTKSMLAVDVATVSDQVLVSPVISLPTGQSPITLQFWNKQNIEDRSSGGCYDGGILEISTDNGANFTQIMTDKMLTDPYDGAISTSYSNPIGGQDAWCGDPQDWLNSIVDLDEYAGQDVIFRFRLATDSSQNKEGWYIDDVKVQSCQTQTDLIFKNGFE